jgi:glycerol-3-phosphate dehydrogenase (NAD(P)+)
MGTVEIEVSIFHNIAYLNNKIFIYLKAPGKSRRIVMENKRVKGGSVIVVGGGNFGTSLAQHVASKDYAVTLIERNQAIVESVNSQHRNAQYLSDVVLSPSIKAKDKLSKADIEQAEAIILAVPTQYLRDALGGFETPLPVDKLLINAAKGIENGSLLRPSQIVGQIWGKNYEETMVALSGPSFAEEVIAGQPTAVVLASKSEERAMRAQDLMHTPFFRAYTSTDPIGVEIGGALKNVIAIATGACIGLGYQQNSRAALMTRGLAEITRMGVALGASPLTFVGLSGVGDLFLTCSSEKSRNYRLGYYMSQGDSLEAVTKRLGSIAEGYTTAKSAYELGTKMGADIPITTQVYEVLYKGKSIRDAVSSLLTREAKPEIH